MSLASGKRHLIGLACGLVLAAAPGLRAEHPEHAHPEPSASQGHAHGAAGHSQPSPGSIPPALAEEHQALHAALGKALREKGPVGEAAKALEQALAPHFAREEAIALPPLGALAALAAGRPVADREALIRMSDSLRREFPRMVAEHAAIRQATLRLRDEALKAKRPEHARFAEGLAHHALLEEQVMYPAAILVGQVLRAAK